MTAKETRRYEELLGALAGDRATLLPLEDALQLVHLYAERGSPKCEMAAMRWLERYLNEGTPRLQHFAEVVASIAARDMLHPGS